MENWFEVEFSLLKVLKLQPSELERMEFYRAEYLMENLKNFNDEEKKRNGEQENSQKEMMQNFPKPSVDSLMKGSKASLPSFSTPNFGNLKF